MRMTCGMGRSRACLSHWKIRRASISAARFFSMNLWPDGRITLDRDAIDHLDGKAISLSEFQKQQALQRRPPLLKRLREPRPAQTGRKPAKAEQER